METSTQNDGAPDLSSDFELNQFDEKCFYINEVENAVDSLETAATFLDRPDNLKWKWIAIAIHHSLYSFCIASLTGSNYENVLSCGGKEDEEHFCKGGNSQKWKKSRRVLRGRGPAYTIAWDDTNEEPKFREADASDDEKFLPKGSLIGFWTALARVQDGYCWMGRKPLVLSEEEWKSIEWLTKNVRNGLIHFVPKHILFSISRVKKSSLDVLRVIKFLALESGTIRGEDGFQRRLNAAITKLRKTLIL